MFIISRVFLYTFFCFLGFLQSTAYAGDAISTGWFSNTALKGYDSVAYFTQNKAVKGSKQFTYTYKGAAWRFSSQDNLYLFQSNPSQYAPQYGGYCAYAASINKLAPSDPTVFEILNGKLYLNYNNDVHKQWQQQKAQNIISADKNWPALLAK